MPFLGRKSLEILKTCHPDIQKILLDAIEIVDFSVVDGHRGQARQNQLRLEGKSLLSWPDSKHNAFPSNAVDVLPWPPIHNEQEQVLRLAYIAGVVNAIAYAHGIGIEWGGDWEIFKDLVHFQLVDA